VTPPLEEMENVSEAQLAHIKGFTIEHDVHGKIEWENEVDVRGLNLDEIIKFEPRSVEVYSQSHTKPERGTQLNQPAIITLNNIWPGKRSTKDQRKLKEYEDALRTTEETEFIHYKRDTGEWKFRVAGF